MPGRSVQPPPPPLTAPAQASSVSRLGEGGLEIEEHGAVAIVLHQRINVRDVAVHDGHHRLPCLVGMFQPEHMP